MHGLANPLIKRPDFNAMLLFNAMIISFLNPLENI